MFDGTSLLTPDEAAIASTLQGNIGDLPTLEINDELSALNASALEKAAQLSRKREIKELRGSLYGTNGEGVNYALEAVAILISHMEKQAKGINKMHPRAKIEFRRIDVTSAIVYSGNREVRISWQQEFSNTIEDAELLLEQSRSRHPRRTPEEIGGASFVFDVDSDYQMGWREKDEARFITSEKLAGECLDRLMTLLSTDSK